MLRPHIIPPTNFDEVATGRLSATSLQQLRDARYSKHLFLLWALVSQAKVVYDGRPTATAVVECFATMAKVRREDRDAFGEVLLYPTVGIWLHRCLRGLSGVHGTPDAVESDVGHIGVTTVAMASRAGTAFDLPVLITGSQLTFPTMGVTSIQSPDCWARASGEGDGRVDIVWPGGRRSIVQHDGDDTLTDDASWAPVRRVTCRAGVGTFDVALEDVDPYRDCGGFTVGPRIGGAKVARWRSLCEQAWFDLTAHHPHRATAVGDAVVALIPMDPNESNPASSATSAEAPGAVATTLPSSPIDLAATLVHEVQHLQLAALLDVVQLHNASADAIYYAPWRSDPRPFVGLLHGAYAFFGVAGFWREKIISNPISARRETAFEFEFTRLSVQTALMTLTAAGHLTVAGRRFVEKIREEVSSWDSTPVPYDVAAVAESMSIDTRILWRLRNSSPSGAAVHRWTEDFLASRAYSSTEPEVSVVGTGRRLPDRHGRLLLVRDSITRSKTGGDLRDRTATTRRGVSEADLHYAAGRFWEAAELYRTYLACDPDDLTSFAGLALARRTRKFQSFSSENNPEIVYSIWKLARTARPQLDPYEVAHWMDDAQA